MIYPYITNKFTNKYKNIFCYFTKQGHKWYVFESKSSPVIRDAHYSKHKRKWCVAFGPGTNIHSLKMIYVDTEEEAVLLVATGVIFTDNNVEKFNEVRI